MMSFGAHAFIWAAEWTSAGAETVVRGAAEAGLDYVEIPLLHPDEMDVPGTRAPGQVRHGRHLRPRTAERPAHAVQP